MHTFWLRPLGALGIAACMAAAMVAPVAFAQTILSAQDIADKLKTQPAPSADDEEEGGLPGRRLPSGPRPDPVSRLCEARPPSMGGAGAGGDAAFRNLVVQAAPTVSLIVEFDFGKASLRPEGAAQLDALATAIASPGLARTQFMVAGHTDAVGAPDANDRLSCARALAAKQYLVDRHRVSALRLVASGMGSSDLFDRADPKAAANRRVVVKVLGGS